MLDNGVDPKLMGKLLGGRRVELLSYGSSASASWYFRLKNYIVASGIHPEPLLRRQFAERWAPNTRLLGEAIVCALLLFGIIAARSVTTSDFIYFQF
jgi:hypothetical protein